MRCVSGVCGCATIKYYCLIDLAKKVVDTQLCELNADIGYMGLLVCTALSVILPECSCQSSEKSKVVVWTIYVGITNPRKFYPRKLRVLFKWKLRNSLNFYPMKISRYTVLHALP